MMNGGICISLWVMVAAALIIAGCESGEGNLFDNLTIEWPSRDLGTGARNINVTISNDLDESVFLAYYTLRTQEALGNGKATLGMIPIDPGQQIFVPVAFRDTVEYPDFAWISFRWDAPDNFSHDFVGSLAVYENNPRARSRQVQNWHEGGDVITELENTP